MVQFLGKQAGDIGFGLMGLTWRNSPLPDEQAFGVLRTAIQQESMSASMHRLSVSNATTVVDFCIARYLLERRRVLRTTRQQ